MWQSWYSQETFTLKLVFNVFSEYQGRHTDGLLVSVCGGLIIYVLTLASLNCPKPTFLTWIFIEVKQSPIFFSIIQKIFNACVIRMLLDIWIYLQSVCFITVTELVTVTPQFVGADYNGLYFSRDFVLNQIVLPKVEVRGWIKEKIIFVEFWNLFNF